MTGDFRSSFIALSSSLSVQRVAQSAARVPRAHEVEGSNPSTLTCRGSPMAEPWALDRPWFSLTRRSHNGSAAGRNPADLFDHWGFKSLPTHCLVCSS